MLRIAIRPQTFRPTVPSPRSKGPVRDWSLGRWMGWLEIAYSGCMVRVHHHHHHHHHHQQQHHLHHHLHLHLNLHLQNLLHKHRLKFIRLLSYIQKVGPRLTSTMQQGDVVADIYFGSSPCLECTYTWMVFEPSICIIYMIHNMSIIYIHIYTFYVYNGRFLLLQSRSHESYSFEVR